MPLPEFTDEQINAAQQLISSYDISMCDGWRNDGCETPEEAQEEDDRMREDLIESLQKVLGIDAIQAEEYFDAYS